MKKRLLITSIVMMLVVAVALSTATYAWFSTNASVTATGMTVTAVSDSLFLEISGAADSSEYSTTGTSNVNASLHPVAHETWSALSNIEDFDIATASTYDNWYYRYSDKNDDADSGMSDKNYIDAFSGYVATTTFSVKLNGNSGPETAYDLYVTDVTLPANTGIKLIVAGANGYKEFSASAENITFANADVLSDTVTKTAQTVKVYIYIDGNNDNVTTANISALTGAVSFKLAVSAEDHTA